MSFDWKAVYDASIDIASELTGARKFTWPEIVSLDQSFTDSWYGQYHDAKDFSIYSTPVYLFALAYCYKVWTKANVSQTIKFFKQYAKHDPSSILDVFAGSGLSSVHLAAEFPGTYVLYHNTTPLQTEMARRLAQFLSIKNIVFIDEFTPAEAVCGFEVFEHFQEPCAMAKTVLDDRSIRYYVDVSSFNVHSTGHFDTYFDSGVPYSKGKIRKPFNATLRSLEFDKAEKLGIMPKAFWNNTPSIWVRP